MMKKATQFITGIVCLMLMGSVSAFGQVTIDGDLTDSEYVTMSTRENTNNGFSGDEEVREIVYYFDNTNSRLYIGIKGKLSTSNDNGIGVFLNTSGETGASSGNELGFGGAGHYIDGQSGGTNDNFKADFEVDYMFAFNSGSGSTSVFFDAATKVSSNASSFQGSSDQSGTSASNGSDNGTVFAQNAVSFAFNNGGGSDQGLEMYIPYSELGLSSSNTNTVEIFAFIVSATGFFSDETVPGNVTTGNPGFDADFSSISGGAYNTGSYVVGGVEISGDAGWRMLSFPKTGGTVADISDDTAIQGVTDGDNSGFDSNFRTYDSDGAFETPTNTSTAIGDGYGFITYFFDNTTAGSSELPITLDASGSEPSSEVSVTLNKTNLESSAYYTLVGNPFSSNYDLSQVTVTGGAINNNVQFWDDGAGSYAARDRTTPFIASPWQGFWVEVASGNGATSIEFPTTGKTTSDTTATYFNKSNNQRADVNFELISDNSFDQAIRLSFRDDAKMDWDLDDASKLVPLSPEYATMAFVGDERLQSVFSLPYDLQEDYEIEMQESFVGVSGEFTLSWEGIETMPEGLTLELNDYETGERVDMSMVSSYTFEASETAEKISNPLTLLKAPVAEVQRSKEDKSARFEIIIRAKKATSNEPGSTPEGFALEQNYPNPFNPTTSIQYSVAQAGPVAITIYNVMGQQVATLVSETKAAGTYRVNWDAANMASGIYHYRLQSAGQVITRQMTLIK